MDENKEVSLREAIARGFDRVDNGETEPEAPEYEGDAGVETDAPVEENAPVEQTPSETDVSGQGQPVQNPVSVPAPEQTPVQDQSSQMIQYLMRELENQKQQNAALAQQLQQSAGLVQEQSDAARQAMEQTVEPSITIPVLDFNAMRYEDDATAEKMVKDWQTALEEALVRKVTDQVAAQYAAQMAPIKEDWEAKRKIAERDAAKTTVYGDPRFSDFRDMDDRIERIIASDPEFDGLDAQKRYLYAGLMARGLNQSQQKEPTAEDIVAMVRNNPDAMRMLDEERARNINDRNAQIPKIVPSSGYSTANAVPDETPKTKEDLFRRIHDQLTR